MELQAPPLAARLRRAHWIAIDVAVVLPVATVVALASRGDAGPGGSPWYQHAVVLFAVAVAASRRCWSPAVLAGLVVAVAAATDVTPFPEPWMAAAYLMYLVPLWFDRPAAQRLLVAVLLANGLGLSGLLRPQLGGPVLNGAAGSVESSLLIGSAWTIGYAVQQQRLHRAGLLERAEQRTQQELAAARRALSDERLRIARELHDVVAHSMSLIAVQAGVANHVAAEHPEEAQRALASIEETSRGALREMRALLGVLREEDGPEGDAQPSAAAPAPGLADLAALAARTTEAGVRVQLEVSGERPELSAGLELAAYRVVQEALTNVVKHAATDHCRVVVGYGPDGLALEVVDEGAGAVGPAPTGGHGLVGMRERVAMYGGEFQAGPAPGRGFRVSASFPSPSASVSASTSPEAGAR